MWLLCSHSVGYVVCATPGYPSNTSPSNLPQCIKKHGDLERCVFLGQLRRAPNCNRDYYTFVGQNIVTIESDYEMDHLELKKSIKCKKTREIELIALNVV
ncbi:hypothetical protein CPC08DRAFT_468067 [Agrocybe pediades]|nr:hypothetical protein CPC08DRAFT_468067 [Agrocybe pediades]